MGKRRRFTAKFKKRATLREAKTLQQIAAGHGLLRN